MNSYTPYDSGTILSNTKLQCATGLASKSINTSSSMPIKIKFHHLIYFCWIVLLLPACVKQKSPVLTEAIVRPIKYEKVGYANYTDVQTFSGIVKSSQETKMSFRVGGKIRMLNVELGDRVSQGQLIATIDAADYSIQADRAIAAQKGLEANLKNAEAQLVVAKLTYERISQLYDKEGVSLSEFEKSESNYKAATAQYEAAKSSLTSANKQTQSAHNQVNYTRLTAPFSGVITQVFAEANELVTSGMPIAVLSAVNRLEVEVGVPETYIAQVRKGQNLVIRFSALPNRTFRGSVDEIAYAAVSSPTYPVKIRIQNLHASIRPGMAASVDFQSRQTNKRALLVSPLKAIGEDSEGNFAYILKSEGKYYTTEKRKVKVGTLLPNGFEIIEGLKEGDIVATAGLGMLLDGMTVSLLDD